MARKLIVDIDELNACKIKIDEIANSLKSIQEELQKAVENMREAGGWISDGSNEFLSKYNTSWVTGITDRYDVMVRMSAHLQHAVKMYNPVLLEAEKLNLESEVIQ